VTSTGCTLDTVLSLLLLTLCGAEPITIATPGLNVSGLERGTADALVQRLAAGLKGRGVSMTTPADVAVVLGLERQRQLLGCSSDSSNCAMELAAALNARVLLGGSIARVGAGYAVHTAWSRARATAASQPSAHGSRHITTPPLSCALTRLS
jgi:hypothetical protein